MVRVGLDVNSTDRFGVVQFISEYLQQIHHEYLYQEDKPWVECCVRWSVIMLGQDLSDVGDCIAVRSWTSISPNFYTQVYPKL